MSQQDIPTDAPQPRLCHVKMWLEFPGYGFNLHSDKTRPGQYIGKVDEGSPAEAAGLKERDRIIEVNGVNISNENHKQVVERIKSKKNETLLLVLDEKADSYYKEREIIVRGDQSNVLHLQTTSMNGSSNVEDTSVSVDEEVEESDEEGSVEHTPPPAYIESDQGSSTENQSDHTTESATSTTDSPKEEEPVIVKPVEKKVEAVAEGLNLNMTAAQLREQLSKSKKTDPRKEKQPDLWKKFNIVQAL